MNTVKLSSEEIVFTPDSASGRPGTWFSGRFLYFEKTIKRSLIVLEKSRRQVENFLEFIVLLIALAGWAAFGYWLYRESASLIEQPLRLLFFWSKSDPLITVFLLSLWFDLFFYYRRTQQKLSLKKINYRLFVQDKKDSGKSRKRYNVTRACSLEVSDLLDEAYLLAAKKRHPEVSVLHLFAVLLRRQEVQALFIRLNVEGKKLVSLVESQLAKIPAGKKEHVLAPALEELLILAFIEAYNLKQDSITVLNLLAFAAAKDERLATILFELEVDADKMRNAVDWLHVNQRLLENYKNNRRLALLKPGSHMNRAYTAIATPTLDHFSSDLTIQSKYGAELFVGRDKEIASIFEAFTGGHSGVLLVGPAGTGKSAIVEGLAQLMVEENVPEFLKDKRLVRLDVPRLVSGANAGQAEERLLACIAEANRSGNIIFYIDNLENLIGISAGSQESLDLSEVLADALDRHHLLCLAAATSDNYARYIENRAIGNSFSTIAIKEPDDNETIHILESKVAFLESKYDVYIVYDALEQAVKMSRRYLHDQALPLKAIELLERAAMVAAKKHQADPEHSFCGREEVAAAIGELTGIPVAKVTTDESQKLLNLEDEIHRRLIGQEEAVKAVCASLRRARAQMKDSRRPIASFLFLGPTGVGKTELAKAVSETYFGDEDYLIRLDMSEYQNQDSVKKMIGDPDGTLGYLTEAVRKKPFSLILLDEIEKAHPDILNLFLQLLDDGRLTDGQGRTISFSESIIIATSNIGAVLIQDRIKAQADINIIKQELIDEQLNKYMRPELINRFDGIIVFRPLSEEDVFKIAALMLKKIKKTLLEKGISLKADKDGVEILARAGYDPKFGARPLRRLLQDRVEDDIARRLLSGELKRRDTVIIDNRAEITVEKAPAL